MSLSRNPNFVAGDEDLRLHELFDFANAYDGAADTTTTPINDLLHCPRLGSPFAEPIIDFQGQAAGWLSPSSTGPIDSLDAINFDDFLDLDEGTDSRPSDVGEPISPLPPVVAASSTSQDQPAAAAIESENIPAATTFEAAQAEITQLKALLAAESPRLQTLIMPGSHQSSISSRKRKVADGEVSPPKRQIMTQVGPIEALWSPKLTENNGRAFANNLPLPLDPPLCQGDRGLSAANPSAYISNPAEFEISPEDLHSIQTFLHDDLTLVQGISHQVNTSNSASGHTMAHPVNMKIKRAPSKHVAKPPRRVAPSTAVKIVKRTKTTPKKTQHQRTTSTASTTAPSPSPPTHHRSIEELLAANFYSLNEQEKLRLVLPMLRNLDPRALEASLAALPCIQTKGPGHQIRVACAIYDSPPTPEADDALATRLTFGSSRSPSPITKTSAPQVTHSPGPAPAPAPRDWCLTHKVSQVETSEDLGAARQREALEKAAMLQAQCKKR